jgi:hypothetical protein
MKQCAVLPVFVFALIGGAPIACATPVSTGLVQPSRGDGGLVLASNEPIPGIDIIVRKKPGGGIVKNPGVNAGGNTAPAKGSPKALNPRTSKPKPLNKNSKTIGFAPLRPAEF